MSQALAPHQQLSPNQIADISLASSLMTGAKRRAFQAKMALKYCGGSARLSETVFGWKRQTVALGLAEKRSGITIKAKDTPSDSGRVRRLSLDSKATVKIGNYSRGGETRGDNKADDHDMGCEEKYIPCGVVDEDSGQLYISFGSSSKTSDFIVDTLEQWWHMLKPQEQKTCELIQIKVDNGPESSGLRTQFLKRMVKLADTLSKPIQLLYYPPYHSKYNPIERCWGVLEKHWNGAKLIDVETMLAWAQSMTWKGLKPIINLSNKVYQKGISLSKKAMKAIEKRLERNPLLPKWDILIRPA